MSRGSRLFRRAAWDAERTREMEAHLALQIDDLIRDGMSPADARREAYRQFGNPRALREEIHEMNSIALVETAVRDARYAARVLRRSPAFAVTAVATLALAIGVNTAVFSIADAALLKPLPYPAPDRLALATATRVVDGSALEGTAQNGTTWEALRQGSASFDTAVYSTWTAGVNIVANGSASHVQQQRVGAGFFSVLGVAPLAGREFNPEEDRAGGPAAVILGHDLAETLYGRPGAALGATLDVRGERATIVGIMPRHFRTGEKADLWTPLRATATGQGGGENFAILVRVRDGAAWASAQAEVNHLAMATVTGTAEAAPRTFGLQPLQQGFAAGLRQPILMLWGAVLIVLVVACVNLAGLLLARGSGRARELATRMALGSGRAAVIRQLLVESVVLAAIGGVIGVALGFVLLDALKALAGDTLDIWRPLALDGRAIGAAGVLALLASVVFGTVPAWHATRVDVQAALAGSSARTVAGTSSRWPRRLLVVAQVALGVVLLVAAGLLLRSFTHLRGLQPGFDGRNVITASVSLEDARYRTAARVNQMFDDTLARLAQSPGVEAAAVALGLPYERLLNLGFRHLTGPAANGPGRMTSATYVAGNLFDAMRIPLRGGRTFTSADTMAAPGVAIVSETFAREYFPGSNAVGQRIAVAGREREIVGVVGDVQVRPGWGDRGPLAAMPVTYIPLAQANDGMLRLVHGWFSPAFVVRSTTGADAGAYAVRQALNGSDPLLPFASVRTMAQVQAESLGVQRLLMTLLTGLAVAAMLLAAVGVHGLIATSVTERTREMGIRLALGASGARILRTLAMPGVVLSVAGAATGGAAAVAGARLLRSQIWGISPSDPATFAAVIALLLLVATIASVLPALRILRLDPARTLRQE